MLLSAFGVHGFFGLWAFSFPASARKFICFAKWDIHIPKQDFRISLGIYRIYDHYTRHKDRREGQELNPFGGGGSLCRW
jgi:hypothetical protein